LASILEKTISEILSKDDGEYQAHLNFLSERYPDLKHWKTSSKVKKIDENILKSLEIIVKASLDADFLINQKEKFAAGNFLNKIVLKTLKVAQTTLATLLFKTPLRVGLAYNALHMVIKYLEKEIKKKEKEDANKKK